MRTMLKRIFCALNFFKLRIVAVGVIAAVLSVTVYAAATPPVNTVYIHDNNEVIATVVETTEKDTDTILKNSGIEIAPQDTVKTVELDETTKEIHIDRAKKVIVRADGKTTAVMLQNGTAADALKLAGVTLDSDDLLSCEKDVAVDNGDEIIVTRVSYETLEITEEIPFEALEKQSPLMKNGRAELLQQGKNGECVRTYTQKTVDGEIEEKTLVSEIVTTEPVSEVSLVYGAEPVSDLDFGCEIVNNAPTEYSMVIENARATGYSAGKGAWGASGNNLFYGHVAVNPNVIPYDSKLYIASPDGKFIYGYAIASDTGTALMDGRIDVDLYYETFRESQLNGVKYVNIYVVE
ncbi:MAG: G5 domain-containing protein [Hydrogenoanaerobacterium sp.]